MPNDFDEFPAGFLPWHQPDLREEQESSAAVVGGVAVGLALVAALVVAVVSWVA